MLREYRPSRDQHGISGLREESATTTTTTTTIDALDPLGGGAAHPGGGVGGGGGARGGSGGGARPLSSRGMTANGSALNGDRHHLGAGCNGNAEMHMQEVTSVLLFSQ